MGDAKLASEVHKEILECHKIGKTNNTEIKETLTSFPKGNYYNFNSLLGIKNNIQVQKKDFSIAYKQLIDTRDDEVIIGGIEAFMNGIDILGNRKSDFLVDQTLLEGLALTVTSIQQLAVGDDAQAKNRLKKGIEKINWCCEVSEFSAIHALAGTLNKMKRQPIFLAKSHFVPIIVEFNYSTSPKKYSEIITLLGEHSNNRITENESEAGQVIGEFLKNYGGFDGGALKNIIKDDIVALAHDCMLNNHRFLMNNVREISLPNIIYLYLKALQ